MHEYGLCEAIVDAVERRADGRRVDRVRVRIGALHRVVEPAFQEAFAHAASGSVAEGADLDLVVVAPHAVCSSCGQERLMADFRPLCNSCGSVLSMDGGDELVLESIQVASPDERSSDVPRHTR